MKPTQLWPPEKSTFCDRSVGEKYHQLAMASHWDESSVGYSIAHCPNNAVVANSMSQRTVYSILRRHRENPCDVKDPPRSGRRRATTGCEDSALVRLARQQRYATSSTLRNNWPTNVWLSTRTVRNRLRQHGHISRRWVIHKCRHPSKMNNVIFYVSQW